MATEGIIEAYHRNLLYYMRDSMGNRMFEPEFEINTLVDSIEGDTLNYKILSDEKGGYNIYIPAVLKLLDNPKDDTAKKVLIPMDYFEKEKPKNGIYNIKLEDGNDYKVDFKEAVRENTQLQPIEATDYLNEEDLNDMRYVINNIITDYENKELGYTKIAYKSLLNLDENIDDNEMKKYQDLKITVAKEKDNTEQTDKIKTIVKDNKEIKIRYFKANIDYKVNNNEGTTEYQIQKYVGFDEVNANYYIADPETEFPVFGEPIEESKFFIPFWKKERKSETGNKNSYSVAKSDYVKRNEKNVYFKALGKEQKSNEIGEYTDLSSVSNNGPGLFTSQMKNNIQYFNNLDYSDIKEGKNELKKQTVQDFIQSFIETGKDLKENQKKIKDTESLTYEEKDSINKNIEIYGNIVNKIGKEMNNIKEDIEGNDNDLDNIDEGVKMKFKKDDEGKSLVSVDNNYYYNANVKFHNHDYYESLECFNSEAAFNDYAIDKSLKKVDTITIEEFKNKFKDGFKKNNDKLGNFNVEENESEVVSFTSPERMKPSNVDYNALYETNMRYIQKLGYLSIRLREVGYSGEGTIIKYNVEGGNGVLRSLVKPLRGIKGINEDDSYSIYLDDKNKKIALLYIPTTDNVGKYVDVDENFNNNPNSKSIIKRFRDENIGVDENCAYVITVDEYGKMEKNGNMNDIKKNYKLISVSDVVDDSGNLIQPYKKSKCEKGVLRVYVYNMDQNNEVIGLKDALKADNEKTRINHKIVLDKNKNSVHVYENRCKGGNSNGGSSSRKRGITNVRCPCNKAKYHDIYKFINKHDNTPIQNKISQVISELKNQEYNDAVNHLDQSEQELVSASSKLMNSLNDPIDTEGGFSEEE
ncbi:hypothetical protein PIROE2DRAFT_16420, partial [Piromyces sp. E2]